MHINKKMHVNIEIHNKHVLPRLKDPCSIKYLLHFKDIDGFCESWEKHAIRVIF